MRYLILASLVGALAWPSHSQPIAGDEHRQDYDRQIEALRARTGAVYILEGADVPLCRRVWAFLQVAHSFGQSEDPEMRQWFLETTGLQDSEALFDHYVDAGLRVLFGAEGPVKRFDPTVGALVTEPALDPSEATNQEVFSEEAVEATAIRTCVDLGQVWGGLLGEMDIQGLSTHPLERYLETQIHTSITSTEPFSADSAIYVADTAFRQELSLARELVREANP